MIYTDKIFMGKRVSRIGFGGAAISGEGGGYGFGEMDDLASEKLLKDAWESGINLFDTAPIYGFGLSEERMGRYLHKDAIIVSKAGVDWHPNRRVNMTNDPKVVEKMLLQSLKRLKREYIDIYMIHWPDSAVDIRRPLEVLQKFKDQSLIIEIGLCNTNRVDLARAKDVAHISCLQSELNLLNTSAFDSLNDDWKNYFTMGWGTFDKGILTGRVKEGRIFDRCDARSWAPWWNKKDVLKKTDSVKKLETVLGDYRISLPAFCIHYNLNLYGISASLIGLKSSEDIVEMSLNLQQTIPSEIMKEILIRWDNSYERKF